MNKFMIRASTFLLHFMLLNTCLGQVDSTINRYGQLYQQEKIHVHFDKPVYFPGETIWFKAYLFAGNLPSYISKNFYVELVAPSGNVLQRKLLPVFESSAAGNFDIPGGTKLSSLYVRAYTSWMLNFDTTFLFNKMISISSKGPDAEESTNLKASTIRFFPEGGDMVSGLMNDVAFKAIDENGMPSNVSGVIKNSAGRVITEFKSIHNGMGKVSFEPDDKTIYTAAWNDDVGNSYETNLPAVKSTGIILQVNHTGKARSFIVKRSLDAPENLTKLYVIAHINQHVMYKATIDLSKNFMTSGTIPTTYLPTGILQVTVFDMNWQPQAERITFINKEDYTFVAEINQKTKNLENRGLNILEIRVPDTIRSNISISVTDEAVSGNSTGDDIISALLLTSDIRGYVHNPSYYFSNPTDSAKQHLDLVMMTHGWRRFKWDDVVKGTYPLIRFPRDNYLSVTGRIMGLPNNRVPRNTAMNIFLEAKDSSTQFFQIPVDSTGQFREDGLVFFDTVKVYYQFNNDKKLSNRVDVNFNNGSFKGYDKIQTTALWNRNFKKDTLAFKRTLFFASEAESIQPMLNRKVKTLEAVTVRAKVKSRTQQLDDTYTNGFFRSGDGYSFNFLDDPHAYSAQNIFQYLQGRVAGLMITRGADVQLSWRGGSPSLFLDEFEVDASILEHTPISNIAYVKVFRPPFYGAFGGGSGGAIAVYTRKGNESQSSLHGGLQSNRLTGYSVLKEFYSPDYKKNSPLHEVPDIRTTLYWNPYILTDVTENRVTIQFYNNDVSRKLRVVLEGVNEDGKVTRVEQVIE